MRLSKRHSSRQYLSIRGTYFRGLSCNLAGSRLVIEDSVAAGHTPTGGSAYPGRFEATGKARARMISVGVDRVYWAKFAIDRALLTALVLIISN